MIPTYVCSRCGAEAIRPEDLKACIWDEICPAYQERGTAWWEHPTKESMRNVRKTVRTEHGQDS